MKQFYTITIIACLMVIGLFSCQKELHFPEAPQVSQFTVEVDGKIYNLDIKQQTVQLGDTAYLQILGESSDMTVNLNAMSPNHQKGVGVYSLRCCSNYIFDRTTGTQKRWRIDQRGTVIAGKVNITKMDSNGYTGTYTVDGTNEETGSLENKQFKGIFVVVY